MEPYLDRHQVVKKKIFEPFFRVQDEEFENGKDAAGETITVTRPITYCHNIRAFLNYVKEDRNLPNTKIKIGLDKGKKSLKFTCSLFSPDSDDQTQDFLLAVVHYVEESYANVLKMLSLCEIDLMDWDFFCSDMKMTMIVCGKYFLFFIFILFYHLQD